MIYDLYEMIYTDNF